MAGRFGSPTAEAMGHEISAATLIRARSGSDGTVRTVTVSERSSGARDHPMEYLL